MLVKYYVCSFITLCIIAFAGAAKETLVLLNNLVIKETHSILFSTLKGRYSIFPIYLVVKLTVVESHQTTQSCIVYAFGFGLASAVIVLSTSAF